MWTVVCAVHVVEDVAVYCGVVVDAVGVAALVELSGVV